MLLLTIYFFFFFFNDTATTEIYTLSLHDALPIYKSPKISDKHKILEDLYTAETFEGGADTRRICRSAFSDRKSTRLNSSHLVISYAVFCLKKKKKKGKHAPSRLNYTNTQYQ